MLSQPAKAAALIKRMPLEGFVQDNEVQQQIPQASSRKQDCSS